MNTRRFLFSFGVALSALALMLFGPVTVSAQVADTAPADVSAVALDHDSIRVNWTWTNSGAGDAGQTGFGIRYQMVANSTIAEVNQNEPFMYADAGKTAKTTIVDDLMHGKSYIFQVRAVGRNADDTADAASSWSTAAVGANATTDAADEPEQVEDLELDAGDMMIMASWDPADTHDDFPLTGYQLMITPKGGNSDIMNIGVMTEYTFEGLMNGTEYTVQVAARNEIGLGDYSDKEMAMPMAATPTPALPLFGAFALGAGLLAAGRARLRRREQRQLTR